VAPWLEAATTPIVIDWPAPAGSAIDVWFGDDPADRVPAVRLDETRFGAELPPRPAYRSSLEFRPVGTTNPPTPAGVFLIDPRGASGPAG
jgi:hypothetical protein